MLPERIAHEPENTPDREPSRAARSVRLEWDSPRDGSVARVEWGISASRVAGDSIAALRLIPALVARCNTTTGYAFPSNSTLAEMVGRDEATVKRGLRSLSDLGLIEIEREAGGRCGGHRRRIFLSTPEAVGAPVALTGDTVGAPDAPAVGAPVALVVSATVDPAVGATVAPINMKEKYEEKSEREPGARAPSPHDSISSRISAPSSAHLFAKEMWRRNAGERAIPDHRVADAAESFVASLLAPWPDGGRLLARRPDRSELVDLAIRTHADEARKLANNRLTTGAMSW